MNTLDRERDEMDLFKREKRFLILVSIVLILTQVGDVKFDTINILGNAAKVDRPMSIAVLLWSTWGWFMWRFSTLYRRVYQHQNEEHFNEALRGVTMDYMSKLRKRLVDDCDDQEGGDIVVQFSRGYKCRVKCIKTKGAFMTDKGQVAHHWFTVMQGGRVHGSLESGLYYVEGGSGDTTRERFKVVYGTSPSVLVRVSFIFRAMFIVMRDETEFTEYYAPFIIGSMPIGFLLFYSIMPIVDKMLR